MRTMIIGDTHIDDPYLDELGPIFDEILSYDADHIIHLGDYYNHNKPSPQSLAFGTAMAKRILEKYKSFTILAGNGRHNWLNGHSVIGYLSHLGVECVGMELNREIDGLNCFFGHYMTNQSYDAYGSHECTVAELKKYDLVFLGHQHQFQQIKATIYHLGSVLYQTFGDAHDTHKYIALIENGECQFIQLKSPIPLVDVSNPKMLPNIDARSKVRLLIPDFETFKKHVNDLGKWKKKFVEFKYELRYDKPKAEAKKREAQSDRKKISIIDEINRQVKDKQVRELLVAQFKEVIT